MKGKTPIQKNYRMEGEVARKLAYDELDELLIQEDKSFSFLEKTLKREGLSVLLRRCVTNLACLVSAVQEEAFEENGPTLFSQLSENRQAHLKGVIGPLHELKTFVLRIYDAVNECNEARIPRTMAEVKTVLSYVYSWLLNHPRLLFLATVFSSPREFFENAVLIQDKILENLPELIGVPYSDEWQQKSCIKVAVKHDRFPLAVEAENATCTICQESFTTGEDATIIVRQCNRFHSSWSRCCEGPECKCSNGLFHAECINSWILEAEGPKTFRKCPTCRAEFCVKDLEIHTVAVPQLKSVGGGRRERAKQALNEENVEESTLKRAKIANEAQ